MMVSGADSFRHDIPQEFSDEDRWQVWRFSLSKKSFITLLIGGGVTYGLFKLTAMIHVPILGVIMGILLTAAAVALTIIPIPSSEFIKGGGYTLDIILIRKLVRKKKRFVYVRGLSREKRG